MDDSILTALQTVISVNQTIPASDELDLGRQPNSTSLGNGHVECTCLLEWHPSRQYSPQAFTPWGLVPCFT